MKPSIPLVSIVTPSFNQAQYLEDTIKSVLELDYSNVEYIVMDGASSDGSVEIIEGYQDRISYWVSEPDDGQTDAINKGFDFAHGEIYAWINSDDTYYPNAVSEAVEYLMRKPEIGMVYGDADFIDSQGNLIGRFNAEQTSYKRLRRGGVYIPQQAAFWRATLWNQVAPLDTSLYFAMDYDLWLRLARISKIKYHPKLWAKFRLHDDAKTISADDQCWPEMLRIHRRDGGSWFSLIYVRYLLRRVLAPIITKKRRNMYNITGEG